MARIDKENYYLDIAETVLKRATCLRRCYGAIIVKNDEIVATGYNGAPRGRRNCTDLGYCTREALQVPSGQRYELCRSVHAEANAIISAARSEILGGTLYLAGRDAKTGELLPIMAICKKKGVKTITITANADSPLAKDSDVVLIQHVNRETDKYNAQGTTSTTALCMIFHSLQAALIEETGYREEQFGLIHPGGAVGERLNQKSL